MYAPLPILKPVLFIPGLLYEGIVRARNHLYSTGRLPSRRLPAPVISVGNLTLGGTGKTPVVIHTARLVRQMGKCAAVLSRGYGRRAAHEMHIVQPPPTASVPIQELGDEPALMRRCVPGIWMGISADRYLAGLKILEFRNDVAFILDDGFQHHSLYRDLDVLVIDQSQPFLGNRVFPRGSLREPLSALRRSDAVILTGPSSSPPADQIQQALPRIHPSARIFHSIQQIQYLIPYEKWQRELIEGAVVPASAYLVAAVGNSGRFRNDVECIGLVVKGAQFYRDHFLMTPRHWEFSALQAAKAGAEAIITTEKDAIKMTKPPDFPLLVAVQKISIVEEQEFKSVLMTAIGTGGRHSAIHRGDRE